MAGILSPPLTQADVNALMHLKRNILFFSKIGEVLHHNYSDVGSYLKLGGQLLSNVCVCGGVGGTICPIWLR